MSKPDDAKDVVNRFISDAQLDALNEYEHALRTIANLPWWKRWKASDLALRVLGIGKHSPHLKERQ